MKKNGILLMFIFMFACQSILYGGLDEDLIKASRAGNYSRVKKLVEQGADINTRDNEDWTPLHWAVLSGDLRTVRYLRLNGADTEAKSSTGFTPEVFARNMQRIQIYNYLNKVDVDQEIPDGKSDLAGNTIAVVIGNRNYRDSENVEYAKNDADIFKTYLKEGFGLNEDQIWFEEDLGLSGFNEIFGNQASHKGRLYREINQRAGAEPVNLIVFYSGHGAPSVDSGKGYLVPVDADVMSIEVTGYSLETLFDNIQVMKDEGILGKTWVTFDSCFSGSSGSGQMLVENISPVALKLEDNYVKMEDSLFMFSSTGSEVSSWYPENKHGMFTYFLLKGLGGAADMDDNNDITVSELKQYLNDMVPKNALKRTAQEQHPQIQSSTSDFVLLSIDKDW